VSTPQAERLRSPLATIELANPSSFARDGSPLWLRFYDLGLPDSDTRIDHLHLLEGQRQYASELVDQDGDGTADALLSLVDLAPGETKELTLVANDDPAAARSKLTQAELSHKLGGAWQPRAADPKLFEYVGGTFQNVSTLTPPPEHTDHSQFIRYEGPGIESDRVGYRIYLDWRNGFDVFGKKVSTPVLQNVGLDGFESYHHMSDWGMDILEVGLSLGTGGFGYWNAKKKQVELVSQLDGWDASVVNNGDLFSALRIVYKNWKVAEQHTTVTADFSMTAGSRLVHTRLGLSEALPNLAVGLVKHPGVQVLRGPSDGPSSAFTYLGTWGPQSLAGDELGMAVLVPVGRVQGDAGDEANVALELKPRANEVEYYFLAAWQGEPGGIESKDAFVAYLKQEAEKLTIPNRLQLSTAASDATRSEPLSAQMALDWSARLADSELARKTLDYQHGGWDAHRKKKPTFEYDVVGLQPLAYDELNEERPDPRYARVLEKVTGSYVTEQGALLEYDRKQYNIDAVAPGRNLLRLFERTGEKKYEIAARTLRRQLAEQPRTREGAFWHKQKYPSQLWLDGVYMGMPFLSSYSARFEQGRSFDEVVREFTVTRERLRDPQTGLYFHGWDESKKQNWADPVTGCSSEFWGRGMGWLAMALVDVLDVLPEADTKHRAPLLQMTTELAQALAAYQDATGTWWQVVDKPSAPGNYRESSASAMFTYFFAKATRKGYLDPSYRAVAEKAYRGLLDQFVLVHPDGRISMTNQCLVGGLGFGRDGSYRYYMSEPVFSNDAKGNGPFILAGVEMARLLESR
jgi:rhamnogalacturonyl hydrolase YesR